MKFNYKIIVLAGLLIALSGCTNWLEVPPSGKIISGDYWKNEADVNSVVLTCYRSMLEKDYIARLIVYGEMRADNLTLGIIDSEKDKDLMKIYAANILPDNGYAKWSNFYQVINYCNLVLYYTPKVVDSNFTEAKRNAKMAEALALRALNYFYLVRAFDEVPYITEASLSEGQEYSIRKSPQNEILDKLEADLLKAEAWALSAYGSDASSKGRVTQSAIRALLADIYLWRNKYAECITYCDKIINDKTYRLLNPDELPYNRIFGGKNSPESIFELQFSYVDNIKNEMIGVFYRNDEKSSPVGKMSPCPYIVNTDKVFRDKKETKDVRLKDAILMSSSSSDASFSLYGVFKYAGSMRIEVPGKDNKMESRYTYRMQSYDPSNWIIYRLTDIMLMKAEALVQQGNLAPALKIVNTTYMRSNPLLAQTDTLAAANYAGKTEMEQLVLLERQRELMFEGKRWFDLMRVVRRDGNADKLMGKLENKYSDDGAEISSRLRSQVKNLNSLYYPIHKDELNSNGNLKQNPYYEY